MQYPHHERKQPTNDGELERFVINVPALPKGARIPAVDWANVHPARKVLVPLRDIIVPRQELDPIKLHSLVLASEWPPIALTSFDGKLYLVDGHHRFWIAFARGQHSIWAFVQPVPE